MKQLNNVEETTNLRAALTFFGVSSVEFSAWARLQYPIVRQICGVQ